MFTTPDRRVMTLLLAGLLTLFAATTAQAAASATDIHVSGQGLQPAAAFAAVGAPVVWHNDTDGGHPYLRPTLHARTGGRVAQTLSAQPFRARTQPGGRVAERSRRRPLG